jgi:tetratricopeptide (TPR) repeat protein
MLLANAYLAQQQWATAKTHLGQGHGVTTDFDAKLLQPEIHFRAVPATSFSWTNLALVYRLKGWHRKSIEASDRALKKEPVNPLALAIKGKALAQSQQPNAAIKSFQQLAANAPWSAAAYFEIAEIHLATNAPAQAVRAYQKAIELQPNDPSIFFRLGGAYAAAGKDREAADAYRQVITLSPDAAIGYNELAYFYADRQEHLDEAQALAQKALELAPGNGPIMDTLGWVYFKRGAYLEAANQLERAAAQIPGAASVHYHLGMAYFKMGESHKAQNAFHFALRLAPQFNEAGHARQMLAQLKSE